jgi:predicted alpha/beta hydrolase
MPPLPTVIAWTLAGLGVAALSTLVVREWRRVNALLNAHDLEMRMRTAELAREDRLTLRRDPRTGVYRPE